MGWGGEERAFRLERLGLLMPAGEKRDVQPKAGMPGDASVSLGNKAWGNQAKGGAGLLLQGLPGSLLPSPSPLPLTPSQRPSHLSWPP